MGLTTELGRLTMAQQERNAGLVGRTPLVGPRFESNVLPFRLDLAAAGLGTDENVVLAALEKRAATIAIKTLVSLAQVGEIDHLGGGLELIPALLMTLGVVDYDARHFTIEHGHTSIGYYGALSALGFLPEDRVIERADRDRLVRIVLSDDVVVGGNLVGDATLANELRRAVHERLTLAEVPALGAVM